MCLACQGILLTYFESYVWPMQGPCCFGPSHASDIIILYTPRGDLSDLSSSSYGLSLFSSKAGSHPGGNVGPAVDRSASVSIGELWPKIDQLDETSLGDTSMTVAQNHGGDQASCSYSSCRTMGSRALIVCLKLKGF
jgi:hypothetical protein